MNINAQLNTYHQTQQWIAHEIRRLSRLPKPLRVKPGIELIARSRQLQREYSKFYASIGL